MAVRPLTASSESRQLLEIDPRSFHSGELT